MKGDGSCEMMKSWRESDVAARKAAKRSKSVNCQLGTCPLVRAKRRAWGGGETGYEDWGIKNLGGFLLFQLYMFR